MKKVILNVGGMSCSGCATGLEKYLNRQSGIQEANVNLVLGQAFIVYENHLTLSDLEKFIRDAGFESLGVYTENKIPVNRDKKILCFFAIYTILFMILSMLHMFKNFPFVLAPSYAFFLFLLTIPFLFYGFDIFKSGINSLLHKMPNMDTLVMIGVCASLCYSIFSMVMVFLGEKQYMHFLYFESVTMVIFFVKLGRYIDYQNKEKTKEAIQELVQITPTSAILKKKKVEKEVTIDEIEKGDILIAKPGMKIAVDGKIIEGETHVNEAFITGESIPFRKVKNDRVVAGSINLDGYIEYKAEKIGKDSTISSIVHLVMEATNTKMPISRAVDRVSSYFVPFILLFAFFTFFLYLFFSYPFSSAMNAFVTVLVVACPCALGLATPLAIVISEGMCAKNGILVKSSAILEVAKDIDTVVFDKTGTLTYGNMQVSKIYNFSRYSDEKVIEKVVSIEAKSTHPIATSFLSYSKKKSIKPHNVKNFENISGVGVSGKMGNKNIYVGNERLFSILGIEKSYEKEETLLKKSGNSIVYVIENGVVLALIGVKDKVRKDAKKTIMELKCMRKNIIMLTGDHIECANKVAYEIGISNVIAGVVPKEKKDVITKLIQEGKKVMMVGDGVNDAPSLASATVGVSITDGTDIAADSADVLLLHNKLDKIIRLMHISEKTVLNIKQNLFWAFFYNICMLPIATGFIKPFGFSMNPMLSSFFMMLSSLTVVFNALRLKKI